MKSENLLPGDIIVNRRLNAYEGGPLRWKIVARRSGNDGWELVHPDIIDDKSAIADDIFEKNGWEFESREEPDTPLYWGEVITATDDYVTVRLAKGNHSTGVVGTHVAVFTDPNWDGERTAAESEEEEKVEALRKARDLLVEVRDTLEGVAPLDRLITDWHAWMHEFRPHLRLTPDGVEGSTCPCRICGGQIEGVPTTSFHEVMVPLPHEHEAYVRLAAKSTLRSTGAFCGRCMTFASLSILLHNDSWVAQEYFPEKIVIPDLGGG